tara:strand:+ start:12516 stop:14006 length:1491 start_codon:yes stop_codon:yes gene_type:complete
MKVRVRFAPSPTGPLHIGGLRTALFNYLFAKKHQGAFVLRVEDTDQSRLIDGAENYIQDALNWLGIPPDESPAHKGNYGPYRQSERKTIYEEHAMRLVREGKAYYAFDSTDQLEQLRTEKEERGSRFIYNHNNREELYNSLNIGPGETSKLLKEKHPFVIRFKSPANKQLQLDDMIRGRVIIDSNLLDDKILFKSDGFPTYHLANVIDDHLMEISHVIRGEEWLPSLALHSLLYHAFEWEAPQFAHLPLLLKPQGKGKLSKRDGEKGGFPVFPLSWGESIGFKESGYLSGATLNFLALLGWNDGVEQEIYSIDELKQRFDIARVNKSGAHFDINKLKWFNHHYIQQASNSFLAKTLQNKHQALGRASSESIAHFVSLVKERETYISDIYTNNTYFFESPVNYDPKALKKQIKEDTPALLAELTIRIKNLIEFNTTTLSDCLTSYCEEKNTGLGRLMGPVRLSLVGELKGPSIYEIMVFIGKESTLQRIYNLIQHTS